MVHIAICIVISLFSSGLLILALHLFGVARVELIEKTFKLKSGLLASKQATNTAEQAEKPTQNQADEQGKAQNLDASESKMLYSKRSIIALAIASILVFFAASVVLNFYVFSQPAPLYQYFSFVKLFYVFFIVGASALIDLKKKIIPNKLIVLGLILRAIIYIPEIFLCKDVIKDIVINDLIGFAIGFGVLFIVGLITKGSIGFGDIKLFAVIGLSIGFMGTLGTLFLGLLASSVGGIILLIRYKDKKRTFAFGPFIFIGYALVILLGAF